MVRIYFLLCIYGLFLNSCAKIEDPEFRKISGFKVKSVGLSEARISLGMTYFNPNSFTVSVKETDVKVYLDDVFLGNLTQDSTISVREEADFTIPLSGSIPLQTFFQLRLKDMHKRSVTIRAEGTTKVGKAGIFITKSVRYQGSHRFDQLRF